MILWQLARHEKHLAEKFKGKSTLKNDPGSKHKEVASSQKLETKTLSETHFVRQKIKTTQYFLIVLGVLFGAALLALAALWLLCGCSVAALVLQLRPLKASDSEPEKVRKTHAFQLFCYQNTQTYNVFNDFMATGAP